MMLGRYKQQPGERRKRGIDYDDFLEDDELLTDAEVEVTPTTDPPFVINGVVIDPAGKEMAYYAGGGVDGQTYLVEFTFSTNAGQTKQDTVEFDVEEDE